MIFFLPRFFSPTGTADPGLQHHLEVTKNMAWRWWLISTHFEKYAAVKLDHFPRDPGWKSKILETTTVGHQHESSSEVFLSRETSDRNLDGSWGLLKQKKRRKSSQPAFCKSWLFNTFVRLKDMYESSMSWSNQKNLVPARLPMCILTFLFRDGVFNISPFVDGIHNPLECVKYVSYWFTYLFNYSIYLPIYQ